ncbi:MAG: hypothetical protein RBQ64_01335 [Candidatus Izemoplasmatales bacterium]|jgi:hypothetical protein|nr:hypothetical protein [Candidatus Izemoplasmatales bacterium]
MFEVFANSIVNPKQIINYHNKKGGFVFLYILILVLLMSISTFVFYISNKPIIPNEQDTGCEIVGSNLMCSAENYDPKESFEIYDFEVYLLNEGITLSEAGNLSDFAIVIQGSNLRVFIGGQSISSIAFLSLYDVGSIEMMFTSLSTSILTAGIIMGIFSNVFIILFIILISTIPFLRFKRLISYKKIFKMLTFASTPMAFLFAIYNLLNFDTIIFFILMMFAYRSVFTLQKELHFRVLNREGNYQQSQDNEENQESNDEDEE